MRKFCTKVSLNKNKKFVTCLQKIAIFSFVNRMHCFYSSAFMTKSCVCNFTHPHNCCQIEFQILFYYYFSNRKWPVGEKMVNQKDELFPALSVWFNSTHSWSFLFSICKFIQFSFELGLQTSLRCFCIHKNCQRQPF